jgi:outer membrane protein assembly factor BamB
MAVVRRLKSQESLRRKSAMYAAFFRGLIVASFVLLTKPLTHADWPQWRGPQSNLVVPAADLPIKFSQNENMLWEIDLGGEGSSTPAVWNDNIYITVTADGKDVLASYGINGQERWRREVGDARESKHKVATGSNPSPVTDGRHVVSYFKSGQLACIDTAGEVLWNKNLQDEFGKDTLWWDLGTSPILTTHGVVVAVMQEGDSYLVCLDLDTGDVRWRESRTYERPSESDQSYTTPVVAVVDGRETIVTWGADHLTGHDAETGELLWDSGGFNPDNQGMWRSIASATVADGVAIVPYGRGDFLAAVKLGGSGDVTTKNRLWDKQGVGADVPCPIVAGGKIYVLSDRGKVTCLDLASGDELWADNLPKGRANYFSSPLLAGDKLYCLREDGTMFVAKVDNGLEVLAENELGENSVATPVPLGDSLLVRTRGKLYRFGTK